MPKRFAKLMSVNRDDPPIDKDCLLSTGVVAKICGVANRTVSTWMEKGELPGYRIPLSQDRRFYARDVAKFLKDRGVPVPRILSGATTYHVLLYGPCTGVENSLGGGLEVGYRCVRTDSPFVAGEYTYLQCDIAVVDGRCPGAYYVLHGLRDSKTWNGRPVIFLPPEDVSGVNEPWLLGVVHTPYSPGDVADMVRGHCESPRKSTQMTGGPNGAHV